MKIERCEENIEEALLRLRMCCEELLVECEAESYRLGYEDGQRDLLDRQSKEPRSAGSSEVPAGAGS